LKSRAEHNRKIAEGARRAWRDPEVRARRLRAIRDVGPLEMSNNKCGYRGVSLDARRRTKPYEAAIRPVRGGKKQHLGRFETAELAAMAYDLAAIERYGPKAFVNFPMNGERQARQWPPSAATSCQRGHPYPENLSVSPRGKVSCRACRRHAAKLRALRQAEWPAP
jgi:hypothetical protein